MALLGPADERGYGRYSDYGASWGRLDGELLGRGLDGVECAGEVCGDGLGPEGGCYAAGESVCFVPSIKVAMECIEEG